MKLDRPHQQRHAQVLHLGQNVRQRVDDVIITHSDDVTRSAVLDIKLLHLGIRDPGRLSGSLDLGIIDPSIIDLGIIDLGIIDLSIIDPDIIDPCFLDVIGIVTSDVVS